MTMSRADGCSGAFVVIGLGVGAILAVKTKSRLLWVSDIPAPSDLCEALGDDWELTPYHDAEPLGPQLMDMTLVVVYSSGDPESQHQFCRVVNALARASAVGVFIVPEDLLPVWTDLCRKHGQFLCVSEDASPQELAAKLSAAAAVQPIVRDLKAELAAKSQNGASRDRVSDQIDEEMRLAAKLQRDFLPRTMPQVGPIRTSVFYRPLSYLSGDIYDVSRLDETHLGFFIADAVGHGLPAALFTMFIKRVFQTKRIFEHSYEIVPPDVSLAELNEDICQQDLSSCEFCTAAYCVLDTEDLSLVYARAGHPEPVLIRSDGQVQLLAAEGGLLGIFPEEKYQLERIQLVSGDRLLLYTDGAEQILWGKDKPDPSALAEVFRPWSGIPRDQVLEKLADRIKADEDRRHEDDITVLIVDIE